MNTAGTALAVRRKSVDPVACADSVEQAGGSSRLGVFFTVLLDSISFALFYLPFSSVSDLIGGMWCRMLAKH